MHKTSCKCMSKSSKCLKGHLCVYIIFIQFIKQHICLWKKHCSTITVKKWRHQTPERSSNYIRKPTCNRLTRLKLNIFKTFKYLLEYMLFFSQNKVFCCARKIKDFVHWSKYYLSKKGSMFVQKKHRCNCVFFHVKPPGCSKFQIW